MDDRAELAGALDQARLGVIDRRLDRCLDGVVPRTTLRDLADRVIPGGLDAWLSERTEAGDSLIEITYRLRTDHGINVSPESVRQWRAKAA